MCRHYGWCFNNERKCKKIPMLAGNQGEETAYYIKCVS
jgi:phenylpropionate dioxygenase-like ring-hydroxylating dioxygenase large terminal subunit